MKAPDWASYGLSGQWEVENHGIAPDYEVEMDPKLVREGRDRNLKSCAGRASTVERSSAGKLSAGLPIPIIIRRCHQSL